MTYQNDPKINRPTDPNINRPIDPLRPNRLNAETPSYTGWIIGGLVALALVIGLFSMFGRDNLSCRAPSV